MRFLLLPLILAAPASAAIPGRTAATDYVLARAADADGDLGRAAAGYAVALAAVPGDRALSLRVYAQAIAAGDEEAALAGAKALDAAGAMPPDARLLLVGEAVKRRDWADARAALARIPEADLFAFVRPVVAAWIAFGEGKDGAKELVPGRGGALALPYIAEHRGLLTLAAGREDEGLAAVRAVSATAGARGARLRMAAAAAFDPRRKESRTRALQLLEGDDPALVRARAIVEAGERLPGGVATPAQGLAALYVRLAIDLNRERVTPLALSLARQATFLDPSSAEAWLTTTAMLAASGRSAAGLAAVARVSADDPLAATARDLRLRLLVREDRAADALMEAQAAAKTPEATYAEWTRVGDLLNEMTRPAEAAAAYGQALALAEDDPAGQANVPVLWLLRGGALEQAGDWKQAEPALERAVALAPDQAAALNYLGYARLDRGEDIPAATAMIEKASRLAPDDAAITDSLGWAYYRAGRLEPAIAALEKAAAGEPGDSDINEHLGDAYWAAGRQFEARYAWNAAKVYAEADAAARLSAKIESGPAGR